jgi:hypothetical protein
MPLCAADRAGLDGRHARHEQEHDRGLDANGSRDVWRSRDV